MVREHQSGTLLRYQASDDVPILRTEQSGIWIAEKHLVLADPVGRPAAEPFVEIDHESVKGAIAAVRKIVSIVVRGKVTTWGIPAEAEVGIETVRSPLAFHVVSDTVSGFVLGCDEERREDGGDARP